MKYIYSVWFLKRKKIEESGSILGSKFFITFDCESCSPKSLVLKNAKRKWISTDNISTLFYLFCVCEAQ